MRRTISWLSVVLLIAVAASTAAAQASDAGAQSATSQGPTSHPRIDNPGRATGAKPPDMVCFGYYPNWSIQFGSGEARYLGVNEPDQYFKGDFYWVEEDKVWEWHRSARVAPSTTGSPSLSATIRRESCKDPVRQTGYPFAADVYLPQGDMVSGCCRKLLPGEAAIGKHGVPPATAGTAAPPVRQPSQPAR